MNIWILFCLFAVTVADNYDEELKDSNDLNTENEFEHRPVFPFEAFGLGYDNFYRKDYAPLIAAMEKYFGHHEILGDNEPEVTETDHTKESENSSLKSEQIKSDSSKSQISEERQSPASSKSQSASTKEEHEASREEKVVQSLSFTSEYSKESGKSTSSNLEASADATGLNSESDNKSKSHEKSQISANKESEVTADATLASFSPHSSPEVTSESSRSHVSVENSRSFTSEAKSEEKQNEPEYNSKASSGDNDEEQKTIESDAISSGEVVFVLSPSQERESEIEIFAESSESVLKSKGSASSVSSEERVIDSTPNEQRGGDESFTESKNIPENDSASGDEVRQYFKASTSNSESKAMSRETAPTKFAVSGGSLDSNDKESSSWKVVQYETHEHHVSEVNEGHSGLAQPLTIPAVRNHLEDSYSKLAQMKKRLHKKQNVLRELNQVIDDLQVLCDVICHVIPVKYLVNDANLE